MEEEEYPGFPVIHGQKSYNTYRDTFEIYYAIKTYFNKPYVDDPECKARIKCSNCGETHTVYRPNHGLLHGLRQGLLAREIVNILTIEATPTSAIHDIKNPFAVQVLASFQRSGRTKWPDGSTTHLAEDLREPKITRQTVTISYHLLVTVNY